VPAVWITNIRKTSCEHAIREADQRGAGGEHAGTDRDDAGGAVAARQRADDRQCAEAGGELPDRGSEADLGHAEAGLPC
jgi:hypothetical protein